MVSAFNVPCFHPLAAWRSRQDYKSIVFKSDDGVPGTFMQLKCGKCLGCKVERARQWAVRCMHEASLHDRNCFLTLTYDDYHLPENGSLRPRDITLFFKRLRKAYGAVRYFQCGEYGEKFSRPHHHVCLFGIDFDDKIPYTRSKSGAVLFYSPNLCGLWPFGFHTLGALTEESAAYTALYTIKKVGKDDYGDLHPPYITMSRRPGIGKGWFDKYYADVYNHYDSVIVSGSYRCRPPDYYDAMFMDLDPELFSSIKARRTAAAREPSADKTDERLMVREHCLRKKMLRKKRALDGYVDDRDIPPLPLLPFLAAT